MKKYALFLMCLSLIYFFPVVSCDAGNDGASVRRYSICDIQKVQVYLVPLDDFPSDVAVRLAHALTEDLKICVMGTMGMGTRGLAPLKGTKQYAAEDIVAISSTVIENLPETEPKTCYVLLTGRDINERARNFRFLFAWHEKYKRVSVVSVARMLFERKGVPASNEKIISRLYKMTKRSIGELYFGLTRSSDIRDVMYSPIMGLDNLDKMGTSFIQLKDNLTLKDKTDILVRKATELIQKNDLESLKPLYLLPDTYSKKEKEYELNGIIEGLTLLSREFGNVGRLEINNDQARWYDFIIAGGNPDFQKQISRFVQIVYKTEFSKIGPGFILLQVTEDSHGEPKLRGVGFALIANQANEQIAKGISRKALELLERRSKTRNI